MTTALPGSEDRASLSGHLLFDSYDPSGRLFIHRDGSLALSWAIGMKDSEVASAGELRSLADRVADFFRQLPAGAAAQFILMADRDIQETLRRFHGSGPAHPVLTPLFQAHGERLERLAIHHGGAPFTARRIRVFFTLRVFPGLLNGDLDPAKAYPREKTLLLEHAQAVETFFAQLGLPARRLDADEVVGLLYRILNPERAKTLGPRTYRPDRPIRDQVVRSAVRFNFDTGVIRTENLSTQVLSMVEIPVETLPGMVTRPDRSGIGVLDLLPEAVLVYNLAILDDARMRRRLEKRDAFAWRQLQGPRKKLEVLKIKQDAENGLDQLQNGTRALSLGVHVLVSAPSEDQVREKARTVTSAFDRLGIDLIQEDAYALTLYLQALPMMSSPANDGGMKRSFVVMAGNVADLLPVFGSFQGTRTPEVLLQNRRGELVFFSPFDSDVAPHLVVTGVSGAGKSFFMNYLLASAARRSAHVVILDKGNSYRNLCGLLGGQYVVFDPNRPLRINPLGRAEDLDKERLITIREFLSELCAQGEEPIRKEERTILETAVLRAAQGKKTGELILSDIYWALQAEVKAAPRSLARDLDRLTLSLKPFVGTGAYGAFFDGPSEIDVGRPFTVFELGEIAKRREIAPALLMAIMVQVAGYCGAPEHLSQKKYLVIDEAWSLLQSPATARFIEDALRTFRKINTAAVLLTQQVSDFAGPAGTAIRANAPNRVFLRQTAETVLAMERLFELSPEVKEAIGSLVTAKGQFSELFLETPACRGTARLVPSPELYTAFSTDGEDRARLLDLVRRKEQEGAAQPLLEAIREQAAGRRQDPSSGKVG